MDIFHLQEEKIRNTDTSSGTCMKVGMSEHIGLKSGQMADDMRKSQQEFN
jgi:hypothetical protein